MSISIQGIGWLTKHGYGCVRSNLRQAFENGEGSNSLTKRGIFSHPFKNFGRLDSISKTTAYGVALALQDAGIEYWPERKQDIGIIGTNAEGSLRTDIDYFRDYIDGGRKLSRGNLFIYTLPSSPLGEAAIHFGLQGPLLYVSGDGALARILDTASTMIIEGEAPIMLAGIAEEDEAIFFVLDRDAGRSGTAFCTLSDARSVVESSMTLPVMVQKFSQEAGKAV